MTGALHGDQHTFMVIARSPPFIIKNASDKRWREIVI